MGLFDIFLSPAKQIEKENKLLAKPNHTVAEVIRFHSFTRDEHVDVLNVKCDPVMSGSLRLQPGILPGYHMNKERWITVLLDGTVDLE